MIKCVGLTELSSRFWLTGLFRSDLSPLRQNGDTGTRWCRRHKEDSQWIRFCSDPCRHCWTSSERIISLQELFVCDWGQRSEPEQTFWRLTWDGLMDTLLRRNRADGTGLKTVVPSLRDTRTGHVKWIYDVECEYLKTYEYMSVWRNWKNKQCKRPATLWQVQTDQRRQNTKFTNETNNKSTGKTY